MKRLLIIGLTLFGALASHAQVTIERDVVASGGGEYISPTFQTTWTCGEVAVTDLSVLGFGLTEGFQQHMDEVAACIGDFDFDGDRDTADLLMFLGGFGCTAACLFDIDGDDDVDTADLLEFLTYFGTPCP